MINFNKRYEHKSDFLTIIFPYTSGAMLRDYEYDNIQLTFKDRWLMTETDYCIKEIKQAILESKYKKLLFIGSSKGAFTAMLVAGVLSKEMPGHTFSILCFSAITYLRKPCANWGLIQSPQFNKSPFSVDQENNLREYGDLMNVMEGVGTNLRIQNYICIDHDDDVSQSDKYNAMHLNQLPFYNFTELCNKELKLANPHLVLLPIYKNKEWFYELVNKSIE